MCDQGRTGFVEDGAGEEEFGFGVGIWLAAEVVEFAVGTQAVDDVGAPV
jgi:hypothetical protein